MAKIATMADLFVDELRDLYDAERQLTKALSKMAKASSTPELRRIFEDHLRETQNQVERLDQIFHSLDEKATGKKCAAMQGLIREGGEIIDELKNTAVGDAGLIAAAQKVEHYEISGYGSARTHAQLLGNVKAVSLLEETLNEEKQADRKLNDIAENMVNQKAAEVAEMDEAGTTSKSRRSSPKTRTAGH